uniref:basic proline-rich protein-like n=1 Tax=Nyctereutes procyonoides TaxID=34880 RepID=UPI002444AD48|nr:basic proline-rich protein-like [Nyctereutes procyonoides]
MRGGQRLRDPDAPVGICTQTRGVAPSRTRPASRDRLWAGVWGPPGLFHILTGIPSSTRGPPLCPRVLGPAPDARGPQCLGRPGCGDSIPCLPSCFAPGPSSPSTSICSRHTQALHPGFGYPDVPGLLHLPPPSGPIPLLRGLPGVTVGPALRRVPSVPLRVHPSVPIAPGPAPPSSASAPATPGLLLSGYPDVPGLPHLPPPSGPIPLLRGLPGVTVGPDLRRGPFVLVNASTPATPGLLLSGYLDVPGLPHLPPPSGPIPLLRGLPGLTVGPALNRVPSVPLRIHPSPPLSPWTLPPPSPPAPATAGLKLSGTRMCQACRTRRHHPAPSRSPAAFPGSSAVVSEHLRAAPSAKSLRDPDAELGPHHVFDPPSTPPTFRGQTPLESRVPHPAPPPPAHRKSLRRLGPPPPSAHRPGPAPDAKEPQSLRDPDGKVRPPDTCPTEDLQRAKRGGVLPSLETLRRVPSVPLRVHPSPPHSPGTLPPPSASAPATPGLLLSGYLDVPGLPHLPPPSGPIPLPRGLPGLTFLKSRVPPSSLHIFTRRTWVHALST